jgi:hypothetical protein
MLYVKRYPCDGKNVGALLVSPKGTHYFAQNMRLKDDPCPRRADGLETGKGYSYCERLCYTCGHAEDQVVQDAGADAEGSTVYIVGHTYACPDCTMVMNDAGVRYIGFISPPESEGSAGLRLEGLHNYMRR